MAPPSEMPFAPARFRVENWAPMQAPASHPTTPRRPPLPTSFGGVAAVAERSASLLFGWQVIFAVATAAVFLWAFHQAWGRAIEHAAAGLPDSGRIVNGSLDWPTRDAQILYHGPSLAIVVDPAGLRESGLATDITLSLEADRIAFRSLLGWNALLYPSDLNLSLTRLDTASALSAWRHPAYVVLGASVFVSLMVSWLVLSLIYGTLVWIGAAVLGRPTRYRVARRLAAASLLPGCLMMIIAMALYATRQMSLVGFVMAWPLHIVLGWIFCAGSWTRLRGPSPDPSASSSNPFSNPPDSSPPSSPRPLSTNPFQSPG